MTSEAAEYPDVGKDAWLRLLPPTTAARLPAILKQRGMSVAALARLSGLARPTVSQLVNGNRLPKSGTALSIAAAFGVDPWDLFPDVIPPPRPSKEEAAVLCEFEQDILKIARKHARYSPPFLGEDDLAQTGRIAALTGLRSHDPEKGPLKERVGWLISQRIKDAAKGMYEENDDSETLSEPGWKPFRRKGRKKGWPARRVKKRKVFYYDAAPGEVDEVFAAARRKSIFSKNPNLRYAKFKVGDEWISARALGCNESDVVNRGAEANKKSSAQDPTQDFTQDHSQDGEDRPLR